MTLLPMRPLPMTRTLDMTPQLIKGDQAGSEAKAGDWTRFSL